MAPLSKLKLTSYRRTQPNRDPVEERRSKTLAARGFVTESPADHLKRIEAME